MGDLGKGGDVRVNSEDAGIESVEKVKLVEEAHAPLLCHRVCDPSAVVGHPVLGYTPVHYCGLADTGALCIPTPGAYQRYIIILFCIVFHYFVLYIQFVIVLI